MTKFKKKKVGDKNKNLLWIHYHSHQNFIERKLIQNILTKKSIDMMLQETCNLNKIIHYFTLGLDWASFFPIPIVHLFPLPNHFAYLSSSNTLGIPQWVLFPLKTRHWELLASLEGKAYELTMSYLSCHRWHSLSSLIKNLNHSTK